MVWLSLFSRRETRGREGKWWALLVSRGQDKESVLGDIPLWLRALPPYPGSLLWVALPSVPNTWIPVSYASMLPYCLWVKPIYLSTHRRSHWYGSCLLSCLIFHHLTRWPAGRAPVLWVIPVSAVTEGWKAPHSPSVLAYVSPLTLMCSLTSCKTLLLPGPSPIPRVCILYCS